MARETVIRLKDDLDGTDASVTIGFGWDGVSYEIDLSAKNAAAFSKAVAPYTDAARRVGPARGRSRAGAAQRGGRSRPKQDLAAVREWAGKNGYHIAARGRISAAVADAFAAAQSAPQAAAPPAAANSGKVSTRKAATRKTAAKKAPAGKVPRKVAPGKAAPGKAAARKVAARRA